MITVFHIKIKALGAMNSQPIRTLTHPKVTIQRPTYFNQILWKALYSTIIHGKAGLDPIVIH